MVDVPEKNKTKLHFFLIALGQFAVASDKTALSKRRQNLD